MHLTLSRIHQGVGNTFNYTLFAKKARILLPDCYHHHDGGLSMNILWLWKDRIWLLKDRIWKMRAAGAFLRIQ